MAVMNEEDLPLRVRAHLSMCSECRDKRDALTQDLMRLGQTAERMAPLPQRKVTIFTEDAGSPKWWPWGLRRGFIVTMAAVVVVMVFSLSILLIRTSENRMARLQQEIWEDQILMTEIRSLEDNALPPFVWDVSAESNLAFDEDFMRFVVPVLDNETLSKVLATRGTLLC